MSWSTCDLPTNVLAGAKDPKINIISTDNNTDLNNLLIKSIDISTN